MPTPPPASGLPPILRLSHSIPARVLVGKGKPGTARRPLTGESRGMVFRAALRLRNEQPPPNSPSFPSWGLPALHKVPWVLPSLFGQRPWKHLFSPPSLKLQPGSQQDRAAGCSLSQTGQVMAQQAGQLGPRAGTTRSRLSASFT